MATFDFSQVVDDSCALDQVLDSIGHVDGQVDGGTVEPDPEDAVEEADAHAEELDHQHDDEGGERRVEGVQVVLGLWQSYNLILGTLEHQSFAVVPLCLYVV